MKVSTGNAVLSPTHSYNEHGIYQPSHLIWDVHDCLSEFHEELSLKGLGEEIGNHLRSWTVFNSHIALLDLIRNEEIVTVEMLGPFGRGFLSILLKENCTLVVLVMNTLSNRTALCLQEQFDPQNGGSDIIGSNKL